MRAMHQQFTTALEGLARQNVELQNELNQSRQQAANELAALRQEVRGAPLRGTQATGVGVDTRLLGKPSDFSGAQDDDAAKAAAPIPNATTMDENDRAASTHLCWMMLMICKGAALNIVFLAGERRSRSWATTGGEVRAEDENTVPADTDGHWSSGQGEIRQGL